MMVSVVIAALSALLTLLVLLVLAPKLGWVDLPDEERKRHEGAVPPVGGLAWFLGLSCAILAYWPVSHSALWLLGAMALLVAIGAIDDRWPLPSAWRLVVQTAAVLLALYGTDMRLFDLGSILGFSTVLGPAAIPLTVFACVGVINAMNMVDGMDGLSGSLLAVTLLAIASQVPPSFGTWALLAVAALVPFLALNLRLPWQRRARVFFGDCGSMSAGLLVAWLLVGGSQGPDRAFAPVSALFFFAVPLIDTVSVMWRRISAGKSPFQPDQQHLHHILQRTGLSVNASLLVIVAIAVAFAGLGIVLAAFAIPEPIAALVFLAIALTYHHWVQRGLRRGMLLGRVLQAS